MNPNLELKAQRGINERNSRTRLNLSRRPSLALNKEKCRINLQVKIESFGFFEVFFSANET